MRFSVSDSQNACNVFKRHHTEGLIKLRKTHARA